MLLSLVAVLFMFPAAETLSSEIEVNHCMGNDNGSGSNLGTSHGPGIQYGIKGGTLSLDGLNTLYTYPKTGNYLFALQEYDWTVDASACPYGAGVSRQYCSADDPPKIIYLPYYYNPEVPWRLAGSTGSYDYTSDWGCRTDTWHYEWYIYYQGELCGAEIGYVPGLITQTNPAWKNKTYDNTSYTIRQKGCAMASLTMLMNSEKCNTGLLTVNGCKNCFSKSYISWSNTLSKFCNSVSYYEGIDYPGHKFKSVDKVMEDEDMNSGIEKGYKYILHVKSTRSNGCGHFVFMTGVSEECDAFEVLDPAGKISTVDRICGYRKFK